MPNLDEQLQMILKRAFKVERLPDTAGPGSVERWDSLGHLALITEIESHFGVQLTVAEWSQMMSVRAIREILVERGLDVPTGSQQPTHDAANAQRPHPSA